MTIAITNDFKQAVYGQTRQFDGRVTLNVPGYISNQIYGDDKIMKFDINEEFTTLSDTLPSNQCSLTLDNRDGAFNFLTYSNMTQILASNPTMYFEVGLNLINQPAMTIVENYAGKVMNSTVANGNKVLDYASNTLVTPSSTIGDNNQAWLDNIKVLDGTVASDSTTVSGRMIQSLFAFDIIRSLTDQYGVAIWQGKTLLADKVAIAKGYVNNLTLNWYGYGASPLGSKAYLNWWNGSSWSPSAKTSFNTSTNTPTLITVDLPPATYIQPDGFVYALANADASDGVTYSSIKTDYVELKLSMNAIYYNEWIPAGYYVMDSWQSDYDVQTVSLIGHDWLYLLANFSFNAATYSNMNALIVAIFNTAGVTNYSIDPVVNSYSTSKIVPKEYDCRSLLQSVGIATQCAIYQDRTGKMIVKPFPTLQTSGMFSGYVSSQNMLWHYAAPSTYSEINDDSGNKHISLGNMYTFPKVSLEKSIYELRINVYANGAINHTKVYTNGALNGGTNGVSFTIDNPLIDSDSNSDSIAAWYMNESNYNAVYTVDWRQNPSLESGDMILVDDGMPVGGVPGTTTDKVARITKQEFTYSGFLSGITECRGGY